MKAYGRVEGELQSFLTAALNSEWSAWPFGRFYQGGKSFSYKSSRKLGVSSSWSGTFGEDKSCLCLELNPDSSVILLVAQLLCWLGCTGCPFVQTEVLFLESIFGAPDQEAHNKAEAMDIAI